MMGEPETGRKSQCEQCGGTDGYHDDGCSAPRRPRRYRPRRGQAYVLRDPFDCGHEGRTPAGLILPPTNPRDVKIHRGKILALGPPARLTDSSLSPVVPWDCAVGDEILFTFAVWLERMRSFEIAGVEGLMAVVAQAEVQAVVDEVGPLLPMDPHLA